MTSEEEIAIKSKIKDEQNEFFRQHDDPENIDRLILSTNAARRSMGIPEIR